MPNVRGFDVNGQTCLNKDDFAREVASNATVLEEFDRQKSIGQYPGRSLADTFATEIAAKGDIYAWLHSRVQAADFSGLRIGDYMDVPVAAGSNVPAQTVRYLLAAVDPYYQCSDAAMPHHLAFVPAAPVLVSGSKATNTSYIMWNTTATNNQRLFASPSGSDSQCANQPPFIV